MAKAGSCAAIASAAACTGDCHWAENSCAFNPMALIPPSTLSFGELFAKHQACAGHKTSPTCGASAECEWKEEPGKAPECSLGGLLGTQFHNASMEMAASCASIRDPATCT